MSAAPSLAGRAAAAALHAARDLPVDATYGAKALAVALELIDGETLFWLTFDARWMSAGLGTGDSGSGRA
jgi:hypothetical protein